MEIKISIVQVKNSCMSKDIVITIQNLPWHVPSTLHRSPVGQVPCVVPSPAFPSTVHSGFVIRNAC